jgi:hypothetical protein
VGPGQAELALDSTFCDWGAIIVPPGHAGPVRFHAEAGTPYGTGHVSYADADATLAAIEFRTRRAVGVASALRRGSRADRRRRPPPAGAPAGRVTGTARHRAPRPEAARGSTVYGAAAGKRPAGGGAP